MNLLETEPLLRARFLERPNRFLVRFEMDGQEGLAYMANPGRLGEILLPEITLLLAPRPAAKLPWEVVGAAWSRRWPGDRPRAVFLNTTRVNRLAERILEARRIPELADYRIERREPAFSRSRFDFLLRSGSRRYLLEVKSVTLVEQGLALFPDARTERGKKHLEELQSARDAGFQAGVLFLVQGRARRFLPDMHNDLDFAHALLAARGQVDFLPYRLEPALDGHGRLTFRGRPRRLEIPWPLLADGVADSGLYLLVLRLAEDAWIDVGALGPIAFRAGWYVYVGSAKRGLTQRLGRHLRRRKKLHWHIDHLRARAAAVRGYPIRGVSGECELAGEIARIGDGRIAHFGSTDCGCPGHLAFFAEPPAATARFQELLTRWRHCMIQAGGSAGTRP